jgi:formylmethanofuran dehydrogenase subunit E
MDTCMFTQTKIVAAVKHQDLNVKPHLADLFKLSSVRHDHLCPRQVLGVRMGLAGLAAIGLQAPMPHKGALVIIETDGCFADGIEVATGATVGHRTLRVNDLGKIAATFANLETGRTVRLAPRAGVRETAPHYVPEVKKKYYAQLKGYQIMPAKELFSFREVQLEPDLKTLLSRPGMRAKCSQCGEEIINERQAYKNGVCLCRSCAGNSYYRSK